MLEGYNVMVHILISFEAMELTQRISLSELILDAQLLDFIWGYEIDPENIIIRVNSCK